MVSWGRHGVEVREETTGDTCVVLIEYYSLKNTLGKMKGTSVLPRVRRKLQRPIWE